MHSFFCINKKNKIKIETILKQANDSQTSQRFIFI